MRQAFALIAAFVLALNPAQAQESKPLAGHIWGVSEERFVAFQGMLAGIQDKPYILVGERHGRHAHQGREAFLVGALAEAGRYPSIAFEMLSHEQTETVASYRQTSPEYALGLGLALDWADSNWPSWAYYQPVFDAAFTTKADIIGADLTDAEQQSVLTGQNDTHKADASFEYYEAQMTQAHCGLIEDARARDLARLQTARDQKMAEVLSAEKHPEHGSLLIVGASHVRKSTGIPTHLPPGEVAVIVLIETDAASSNFLTPFQDIVAGDLTDYDYIWFTPRVVETSFCDRLGQSGASE
ncbi:ChaN family lipoprotein (plasmid) [Aquicoccus sp. G2-2]|uniref:ChaN family lipoprotein n=1 Tax=Aquicoccus sp. G2-2 TaxID=3092120 RepID=UPI002ADF38BF|nr:ChaN family lipoprotein [Aquicoccus sp. G2-2]MEA1111971.1 ChaN family lipoprotein [Aquicoccus sp. G2-2]